MDQGGVWGGVSNGRSGSKLYPHHPQVLRAIEWIMGLGGGRNCNRPTAGAALNADFFFIVTAPAAGAALNAEQRLVAAHRGRPYAPGARSVVVCFYSCCSCCDYCYGWSCGCAPRATIRNRCS